LLTAITWAHIFFTVFYARPTLRSASLNHQSIAKAATVLLQNPSMTLILTYRLNNDRKESSSIWLLAASQ
jgi:hypothetical protein